MGNHVHKNECFKIYINYFTTRIMSYITIPYHIQKDQITKINDDIFCIEEKNGWFLIVSLDAGACRWKQNKYYGLSFDTFIKRQEERLLPKKSKGKKFDKQDYICFFNSTRIIPSYGLVEFTSFTSISYDKFKEFYFLTREIFLRDIFELFWKLFFSVRVTDNDAIQYHMTTSRKGSDWNGFAFHWYFKNIPTYTYLFDS